MRSGTGLRQWVRYSKEGLQNPSVEESGRKQGWESKSGIRRRVESVASGFREDGKRCGEEKGIVVVEETTYQATCEQG